MKQIMKFSLVLLTLSLFNSSNGQSTNGQSIQKLGSNYFVAGIPTNEFETWTAAPVLGNQRQTNWCWAACAQMVLNYHGLNVSQEQIVTTIYGVLADKPASESQIKKALNDWAPNIEGQISNIYCQSGLTSINDITQTLAYKWPLIVALKNSDGGIGHPYILTAIYYSIDEFNNKLPDKVILRDPMPDTDGETTLSWLDFSNRIVIAFKLWFLR